jgi:hypothetical protein
MRQEIYEKIISKREFSQLPKKDVEIAFSHFERRQAGDEEKIRLTRDLLRKVFSAFTSGKLLNLKDRSSEWILKKHISTKERFSCYKEIYRRILKISKREKITIIDLGAGVNGFSYDYFPKKTKYTAIESIGQLVDLMNYYFKKNRIKQAKAIQLSLFELKKVKKILEDIKGIKIVFLFKVLDSLEMMQRDYSKKFLSEIIPLINEVVVSFATESLIKRKKFRVNRKWITDFIEDNFRITDEFEMCGERFIVFSKR